MNTLHTFGCSFTAPYTVEGRIEYRQYYQHKNGEFPQTWPELLSKKLGLSLSNYGTIGASNDEIFSIFCQNIDKIMSNDVVIIGWTFKERFRLVNDRTNRFVRITPNVKPKLINVSNSTIDEMLVNRENQLWVTEVMNWERLIFKSLKNIDVDCLTWSFDSSFPAQIFIFDELIKLGAETISIETEGEIDDLHMGENGHIKQCDYLFELLNSKLKTTKII